VQRARPAGVLDRAIPAVRDRAGIVLSCEATGVSWVAEPHAPIDWAFLTFDRAGNETEPAATPDGRYIVFVSDRSGEVGLYRINRDGTGLKMLTPEPKPHHGDRGPSVTPDNQWVLYRHWDNGPTLWKVPIDGGTPVLVNGERPAQPSGPLESAYGASASPDGRFLAYFYFTRDPKSLAESGMEMVVASLDGRILKRFPYFDSIMIGDNWRVKWSRDGSALYYNGGSGGAR
jgi:hypothetical protein